MRRPKQAKWRPCKGWWRPYYEVCRYHWPTGNSEVRRRAKPGEHPHKPLAVDLTPQGFRTVWLSGGGRRQRIRIAKLVMLAFVGPRPKGCVIGQKNWIRDDDRASNLQYLTHQESHARFFRECEVSSRGELHPRHKLTEKGVRAIRKVYADPHTARRRHRLRLLADAFDVCEQTVWAAAKRKSWKHIA